MVINRFTQRPKTSHLDEILALIAEAIPETDEPALCGCGCHYVGAPCSCPHTSTTVAETGPENYRGGTSAYVVCADCGAEIEGPFPGSGVL